MFERISRGELKQLIDDKAGVVVDVLPEHHYAEAHIPGAANACVYQVDFLDLMTKLADKGADIVVYASSPRNRAAADAATKLAAAGYVSVRVFEGGLEEWRQAGLPVEGPGGELPEAGEMTGLGSVTLRVDPAESEVRWFGRNMNITHTGTIGVRNGRLRFEHDALRSGSLTLDMNAITNDNLTDPDLNRTLVAHLKSDDFFEVEKYPEAKLVIVEANSIHDAAPGSPNVMLRTQISIKNQTRPLDVRATVERREDGRVAVTSHLDIDRTAFGVMYGSGRFYEKLGMHLVHDTIMLQVRVVAGE